MKPSFAEAYFENHDNWELPGFKRKCAWNLLSRGHGGGPLFGGGSGMLQEQRHPISGMSKSWSFSTVGSEGRPGALTRSFAYVS